jgi:protein NrfD
MNPEITYITYPGIAWDWRVAADLFLGGAGVGAILFAIFVDEIYKGKYQRIRQTAAWLSPLLVLFGLFFLIMKMGRPFHLYNALINFNPHSPLWWGGIFQPLLVVGSILYALKLKKATATDAPHRKLGRWLIPLAIIVGTYHGLLLAINVSRPLWNTGPTVVAAILGFITTGIAAVLLVHLIRMKLAGRLDDTEHFAKFIDDIKVVRNILVSAIVLQLFTFFLWWLSLQFGDLDDRQALALANEHYGPLFWFMGIGMGLILPLILGAISIMKGEENNRRFQARMILVTSFLILVGGFFFRLAVVLGGQIDLPITPL